MSETPSVGAFAIVPSNDLPAAVPFWERLGFVRTSGDDNYLIMTGWGCEVHLIQAGTGPWRVPEDSNPFGVFIRTPDVADIASRVEDLIIGPGGILRNREWGLYEVGISGPDGLLVRIGWPSRLMKPKGTQRVITPKPSLLSHSSCESKVFARVPSFKSGDAK